MPQPITLTERRARLKTMLKSTGPINMEAYREAIRSHRRGTHLVGTHRTTRKNTWK